VTDDDLAGVLTALVSNERVAQGTVFIVERASRSPDPVWPSGVEPLRAKRYGDTALYWAQA
jgi:16S rRNA (guanine966-N2)-methyltransferase